jgi:predicted amidohydrolase YtcJ
MRLSNIALFVLSLLAFSSCKKSPEADVVYLNGVVYTVDDSFSVAEAFAVKDGKIMAIGSSAEMKEFSAKEVVDLQGKFVYPGFYDAHCHFYGYGVDLAKTWLIGTTSFESILDTLTKYKDRRFMGWVFGRGWDQNDWTVKSFPDRSKLDVLFPDVPVFLMRIDGHAALVNAKALELAGITADTKIAGGEIILKDGVPTGLLIDNAVDLVKSKIEEPGVKDLETALVNAQQNCFKVGLTTVVDAGLDVKTILLIDSLQKAGKLKMKMNAMVSYNPANVAYYRKHGSYASDRLRVNSFKLYADGALGSRGACLRDHYADMPGHRGFLLASVDSLIDAAATAYAMNFQLNTHCIGDSANHLLLQIYSNVLKGKNDKRWRIEHAQVMPPEDFNLFADYSIIPSVQPTHATSDMYWAGDRLGPERLKYAYAYKQLLEQNGLLANGSDFPVEDINPLFGFYAAVVRKDQKNFPDGGFNADQALTREQALKAMTIWAAYASFEEKEKGSLEKGKWADFVVLNEDLMKTEESKLYALKIWRTIVSGEVVFDASK